MDPQKYKIRSVRQWPGSSSGAWVKNMCLDYLKSKGVGDPEAWLDEPSKLFNDCNAAYFVQDMMKSGNCESYADAWHEVLGILKRIYG